MFMKNLESIYTFSPRNNACRRDK